MFLLFPARPYPHKRSAFSIRMQPHIAACVNSHALTGAEAPENGRSTTLRPDLF